MILNHQKFDFKNRCLIEKVLAQAPLKFTLDYPNDACFIYFRQGDTIVNAPYEQVKVLTNESVLLKCGRYFSKLLSRRTAGHYEIIVVHLAKEVLQEIYDYQLPSPQKRNSKTSYIQKLDDTMLVGEFIKSLQFYFDNPSLVSDQLLELKIKELILLLLQTKNASTIDVLFQQLFSQDEINIKEVIHSHLHTDISVQDLAYLCNLSESTFKRRFKEVYRDTPARYIKNKRLERARKLLDVDTMSISEIAFNTGFNDVAHFSRSFKSVFGSSPRAYRSKSG